MREIKFNAWDRATKRWIALGFYILGETTCFDLVTRELMKAPLEKTTLERICDVVIVQYTGIKDKNGKEIYEGDVVRANTKDKIKWPSEGVVEYCGQGEKYCCGYWAINCGENLDGDIEYAHFWNFENFEVIGNVYENPELASKHNPTPSA